MLQRFRLFPTLCFWALGVLGALMLIFPEDLATRESYKHILVCVTLVLGAAFDVWRRLRRVRLKAADGIVEVNRGSKLVTRCLVHQIVPWSFYRENKLFIQCLLLSFLLVLPGIISLFTSGVDRFTALTVLVGVIFFGACIYDWSRLRSFEIPTEFGTMTITMRVGEAEVLHRARENFAPPRASSASGS
jgi:hypothetical protein